MIGCERSFFDMFEFKTLNLQSTTTFYNDLGYLYADSFPILPILRYYYTSNSQPHHPHQPHHFP